MPDLRTSWTGSHRAAIRAGRTPATSHLLALFDIPHDDHRRRYNAGQRVAVGRRYRELSYRDDRQGLIRLLLNLGCELLAGGVLFGKDPALPEFFELRIGRPSEPCFLAAAPQRQVDRRIKRIGA